MILVVALMLAAPIIPPGYVRIDGCSGDRGFPCAALADDRDGDCDVDLADFARFQALPWPSAPSGWTWWYYAERLLSLEQYRAVRAGEFVVLLGGPTADQCLRVTGATWG